MLENQRPKTPKTPKKGPKKSNEKKGAKKGRKKSTKKSNQKVAKKGPKKVAKSSRTRKKLNKIGAPRAIAGNPSRGKSRKRGDLKTLIYRQLKIQNVTSVHLGFVMGLTPSATSKC
jgi:hypothetical protein